MTKDVPVVAPVSLERLDALRVLLLGINAWMVLILLPIVIAGPAFRLAIPISTTPLLFLVAGTATLGGTPGRGRTIATYLLLGAFPTSLVGMVAGLTRLSEGDPSSTLAMILGAASFVAYAGGAVLASGRPIVRRRTNRRPLGPVGPIAEPRRRGMLRNALLVVAGAGALGLSVVAPLGSTMVDYEDAWGEATEQGFVLTSVVGAVLGVVVLSLFVGPSLRASRDKRRTRREATRRALTWLALAAAGGGVWLFYSLAQ